MILYVTEPEADKDVFSDSSEGSDEIIDLSSLSDSEPEEDSVQNNEEDNSMTEPSHLPVNEDVKVKWYFPLSINTGSNNYFHINTLTSI